LVTPESPIKPLFFFTKVVGGLIGDDSQNLVENSKVSQAFKNLLFNSIQKNARKF
jgi:hypothetical protein